MRIVPAGEGQSIVAVSTEDGRVIFYDLKSTVKSRDGDGDNEEEEEEEEDNDEEVAQCVALGQLGGDQAGFKGRIKDFEVLQYKSGAPLTIVTGSSDGAVRLWKCSVSEIMGGGSEQEKEGAAVRQVGTPIGTHETGRRITCLVAFVMDGPADAAAGDEKDEQVPEEAGSDSDDDE
jgi:protein MAK11